MIYSNPEFFVFFVLVACANYALSAFRGLRFYLLLGASFFFYSWAGIFDTFIFVFVVLISWLAIFLADRFRAIRGYALGFGIVVMVLHLFFWKYAPWVSRGVQRFSPDFLGGMPLELPLPVGISFFTLQGIAYLIDYYHGKAKLMPFREYALFKSFFPQLVAGPIVRVHQLAPQLEKLSPPKLIGVVSGLALFLLGFFKKVAIADRMAVLVDPVFSAPGQYTRWALLQAVLAYSVQIWGDFSGYTDMGRGAARMLGFDLPENFLSPYLARSPSDFWKRWHITLSQWIRDYIYIPLGGSKGGAVRVALVALFTMVISGLWHGAAVTFVLWGLFHGALLVCERALKGHAGVQRWARAMPPHALTAGLVSVMFLGTAFGWLIFRAQGLRNLVEYFKAGFGGEGRLPILHSSEFYVGLLFCFVLQVMSLGVDVRWRRVAGSRLFSASIGAVLAVVFLLTLYFRQGQSSPQFIYFQF